MTDAPEHRSRRSTKHWRTLVIAGAAGALGFAIAASLDAWAATHLHVPAAERTEWGQGLQLLGYWPLWITVGVVLIIRDGSLTLRPPLRDRFTRGVLLILSSGLAGLLAELAKLLVRRLRPAEGEAIWRFRPFDENTLSTSGLAMPSSHAAVAFGAAFIFMRLHPRMWPLWLCFGLGCGVQRVLAHAHFASDVYAAALLGYACAAGLWTIHARRLRADAEHAA